MNNCLWLNSALLIFIFKFVFQIYSPCLDTAPPRWVHFAHGLLLFLYQVPFYNQNAILSGPSFLQFVLLHSSIFCWSSFWPFTDYMLDFWCCWWEASTTDKFFQSTGWTFWPWYFPQLCLLHDIYDLIISNWCWWNLFLVSTYHRLWCASLCGMNNYLFCSFVILITARPLICLWCFQFEAMAFGSTAMCGRDTFWFWVISAIPFYGATWEQ